LSGLSCPEVVFLFGAKSFYFVTNIFVFFTFTLYILVACFMVDYLGVFIFQDQYWHESLKSSEESKDLDIMKVEELIGSLQIYEHSLHHHKKNKTIALKTVRKKSLTHLMRNQWIVKSLPCSLGGLEKFSNLRMESLETTIITFIRNSRVISKEPPKVRMRVVRKIRILVGKNVMSFGVWSHSSRMW